MNSIFLSITTRNCTATNSVLKVAPLEKKTHVIEVAHTLQLHETFYGYHENQEEVLNSQPQHNKIVLRHS